MSRFVPERDDIMKRMERDQTDARNEGIPEEEILHYLVDTYHPSFRELKRIRNPLGSFTYVPGNERMLLSDRTTRREINHFNRGQRLSQEIGAMREDWKTVENKIRRVWVYILLIARDVVMNARRRNQRMIDGGMEKDKRLVDKLQNRRRRRMQADIVTATVQEAIVRGRRRRGGAGVA